VDEGDVFSRIDIVTIADDGELAEPSWHPRLGNPVDQLLGTQTVGDELSHCHEGQSVLLGDLLQLVSAGHRSVGVQYLADDTGWIEACQARKVYAGLGLTHPLKHTAGPGPERKNVAGPA
jgi:hypothetical protein